MLLILIHFYKFNELNHNSPSGRYMKIKILLSGELKNSGFDGIRTSASLILLGRHERLSYKTACLEQGKF